MIEFTMVGIPVIFLTIAIIEMSIEAWKYESMMYAIQYAGRYAAEHGRTCGKTVNTPTSTTTNACLIEVETVANMINAQAPSLDPSQMNVTLSTQASISSTTTTSTVTCDPLNSCFTNSAYFPNTSDNGVGLCIAITATYPMKNPIPFMWFNSGASSGTLSGAATSWTLGATTKQTIVF